MKDEFILKATNIHKSFLKPDKVDVLSGVSLSLKPKESIAIIGASGEGKTTLLHILGTLESFDKGRLEIAGNTQLTNETRNRHVGFIFQTYNLLEDFSTLDNILMPRRIRRENVSENSPVYNNAILLLKQVGLENRKHFLAKVLSGGEKQRVAIARALCNNPDIILADEPSGNLDHSNSLAIHNLLIDCVKKHEKSLIVATHDKELAGLCDKTYELKNGQIFPLF